MTKPLTTMSLAELAAHRRELQAELAAVEARQEELENQEARLRYGLVVDQSVVRSTSSGEECLVRTIGRVLPDAKPWLTGSPRRKKTPGFATAIRHLYGDWELVESPAAPGPESAVGVKPAAAADPGCSCAACQDGLPRPAGWPLSVTIYHGCAICGHKRCPHATDHRHPCTGSNAPGQPGSAHP